MSIKNINEYYTSICKDILKLIQEQKYNNALVIIDSELEQPYIPTEYYQKLIQIRDDTIFEQKDVEYEKKISNMSKLEIWNKIYDEKKHAFDDVYFNLLLTKYGEEFDKTDFSIIEKIFCDKKIDNVSKSILFNFLQSAKMDYEFNFYNNYLNQMFKLNPIIQTELNKQVIILCKELEKHFAKNISKSEIAISLIQVLATKFVPNKIHFNNSDIIKSVINITNSLFGEEQIKSNDITDILDNYIK